jgi:hypothetical protein
MLMTRISIDLSHLTNILINPLPPLILNGVLHLLLVLSYLPIAPRYVPILFVRIL